MHLGRRLMLALFGCVALVSAAFALYQAAAEMHSLRDDVQRQALVLAESQSGAVARALASGSSDQLQTVVQRFEKGGRLAGAAVYDQNGQALAITASLAPHLAGTPPAVTRALREGRPIGALLRLHGDRMHVLAFPVRSDDRRVGAIAVYQNVGYLGALVWRHAVTSVAQTLLIVGITLLLVQWSVGRPLHHLAQWLRDLRTGDASAPSPLVDAIFRPLTNEVQELATSLHVARAAAEEEARLRDAALAHWTAERLRVAMQGKLNGGRLVVVSNREPYEHSRQGSSIIWSVPPSGLVTALEPVLRASDGIWVAQGTGDADRETSDDAGQLRVPPDHPQYKLRRVFLSREEQDGFYFGFANEGIWPLCHIAHTRPSFRSPDWEHYRRVNHKFAFVVLDEISGEKQPLVLVQDYHFALLPRMIK